MVNLLIWLVVFILIAGFVYWLLNTVAMPAMLKTAITVVVALIGLIILIKMLFGLVGAPPGF